MRVQRGFISYSPRPLCVSVSPKSSAVAFLTFPPKNDRARLSPEPYLSAARREAPGRARLVPSATCEAHANSFFIVAPGALWTFGTLCWCGRPSGSGGRHVKGEHVKDAANAAFQGAKKYAAARGDPGTSPTPDEVRIHAKHMRTTSSACPYHHYRHHRRHHHRLLLQPAHACRPQR